MTAEFIVNHLWQSSCFVLLTALLAFVLRKNPPKVRYWLWLSASLKFLVPFALLVSLGSAVKWPAQRAVAIRAPVFSSTVVEIAEPFTPPSYSTVPAHAPMHWVPILGGLVWALGFAAIAFVRCRSWLRIRATLRASTPVELPFPIPAFVAPGAAEPGVVGFLRPVLVLPAQLLEHLSPGQLDAVLAHELCHVRRRDNAFAAVHMVVEAIFWFHPLVWWIGSRMVEERELACDEEVLRMGCEPADYVEGILKVCRLYTGSPLPCVSGVTGADVKKRLRAVLAGSIARELTVGKKLALAAIGVATFVAPLVIGVLSAPTIRAQSSPTAVPKWEVASIRQCTEADFTAYLAALAAGGGGRGGGGGGAGNLIGDAGMLRLVCLGLNSLIVQAYFTGPNGKPETAVFGAGPTVRGGPAWTEKERYTIIAKPESDQSLAMMTGPMMQALLEDRFKLKIHRESEENPAYALVVAKGGPKLQPTQDGSCTYDDPQGPRSPVAPGPPMPCGYYAGEPEGIKAVGVTIDTLCAPISTLVRREVIDKTGLTGLFNFNLDVTVPPPDAPDDPAAFDAAITALQKLGLRLESIKGIDEFVVIDHIERPTEN